jgi:PKD repeat protein
MLHRRALVLALCASAVVGCASPDHAVPPADGVIDASADGALDASPTDGGEPGDALVEGELVADFTYSANNLMVAFADASTDAGGTVSAWSWDFGDGSTSTTQSPSHAYAATGTYSVTLTATDGASGTQSTKTKSVIVFAAAGSCLTYGSATTGIGNYTRWTGSQEGFYFGAGTHVVDVTRFDSVFGIGTAAQSTWPGNTGLTADFQVPTNKYISLRFTVPDGFMETVNNGGYGLNTSGYTAPVSITISRGDAPCGDFSNPASAPASNVVPGCWKNSINSQGQLAWTSGGTCVLQNDTAYFLNIINADISNADPAGTAELTSTQTQRCTSTTCGDPIRNKSVFYKN